MLGVEGGGGGGGGGGEGLNGVRNYIIRDKSVLPLVILNGFVNTNVEITTMQK
jgi:hypothetical protein